MVGLVVLAFSGSLVTLLTAAVLYGIGLGLSQPSFLALTVDKAPIAERGQALGTVSLGYDLGIMLGAVILGPVVEYGGYGAMFIAAAAAALIGLVAFGVMQALERR